MDAADFPSLHQPEQLVSGAPLHLTAADFRRINPNTQTCPVFRTRRDAELTCYPCPRACLAQRSHRSKSLGVSFKQGLFNMTILGLFRTREQLEADVCTSSGNRFVCGEGDLFAIYEGRMIHHFDHRAVSVG